MKKSKMKMASYIINGHAVSPYFTHIFRFLLEVETARVLYGMLRVHN